MSDATYHAHWQQSQELHERRPYTVEATGRAGSATNAPTPPPDVRETAPEPEPWQRDLTEHLLRLQSHARALASIYTTRPRDVTAADLDHLLAALSAEKSKPIPEIRDQYGLDEGEPT